MLEGSNRSYIIPNDSYLCFIRFVPSQPAEHHPPIFNTLADASMEQSLKHLRFPLAMLAILVMSACGKLTIP